MILKDSTSTARANIIKEKTDKYKHNERLSDQDQNHRLHNTYSERFKIIMNKLFTLL